MGGQIVQFHLPEYTSLSLLVSSVTTILKGRSFPVTKDLLLHNKSKWVDFFFNSSMAVAWLHRLTDVLSYGSTHASSLLIEIVFYLHVNICTIYVPGHCTCTVYESECCLVTKLASIRL